MATDMTDGSDPIGTTQVDVAGLQVTLSGRKTDAYFTHIENQVRENHFFALAAKHMAAPAGAAVDIGANIGFTAALFGRARPNDALFVIEPSPTAFADLKRNVSLNGLTNTHCFQMGLGLTPGHLLLSEDPTNSSAAHLSSPATPDHDPAQVVLVETLDNFCSSRNLHPHFVKLDVEGHELNVLRGGLITLATDHPVLFIEMNSFTTIAYGRESPLNVLTFLNRHFHKVLWLDGAQVRDLSTDSNLISFLHFHYSRNAGVDDLLCVPDARAIDLAGMQAELAVLRP